VSEVPKQATPTSAVESILAFNDAVARADIEEIGRRLAPGAIWKHNLGSGSVEEGVYEGRESILRLFERIVEPWEYVCPQADVIEETSPGVFSVSGALHSKHASTATPVRTHYEQRIVMSDGLLVECSMLLGANIGEGVT
jgi:hypothetical protein